MKAPVKSKGLILGTLSSLVKKARQFVSTGPVERLKRIIPVLVGRNILSLLNVNAENNSLGVAIDRLGIQALANSNIPRIRIQ